MDCIQNEKTKLIFKLCSVKLLEENIGEKKSLQLYVRQSFLGQVTKKAKPKNINWTLSKLKTFALQQTSFKNMIDKPKIGRKDL